MSLLKIRLTKVAEDFSEDGLDALLSITAEEHADLETLLNEAISTAEGTDFDHYIKLRFAFRIFLKYGSDIDQGITNLMQHNE